MTVWWITGKIIRTASMINYICTRIMEFLQCSVWLVFVCFCNGWTFCFFIVKVKLTVRYYVFVCILPEKAVAKMIYTVLGGTLNPAYSHYSLFTHLLFSYACGSKFTIK